MDLNEIVTLPPDGGLQAWLQTLGSFLLLLNTFGIINSFGIRCCTDISSVMDANKSRCFPDILQRATPGRLIGLIYSMDWLHPGLLTDCFGRCRWANLRSWAAEIVTRRGGHLRSCWHASSRTLHQVLANHSLTRSTIWARCRLLVLTQHCNIISIL